MTAERNGRSDFGRCSTRIGFLPHGSRGDVSGIVVEVGEDAVAFAAGGIEVGGF
jgi:hypothetical protein